MGGWWYLSDTLGTQWHFGDTAGVVALKGHRDTAVVAPWGHFIDKVTLGVVALWGHFIDTALQWGHFGDISETR